MTFPVRGLRLKNLSRYNRSEQPADPVTSSVLIRFAVPTGV
jgi:hypothetical protein